MNAQDILNLVKAGFTHDEIIALAQEKEPVPMDPVPAAAPNPAPVPEPTNEPAPAPAPAPVPDPVPDQKPNQPDPVYMIAELTLSTGCLDYILCISQVTRSAGFWIKNKMINHGISSAKCSTRIITN